jgi:TatD DNase family protein
MQYYDAHTHNPSKDDNIVSIYNVDSFSIHKNDCFSIGIHPMIVPNSNSFDYDLLYKIASNINCKAVGECGLDSRNNSFQKEQIEVFKTQIEIANQINKPLIIHCVKAYDHCLKLLSKAKVPVVFHGFNKHPNLAKELVNEGYYCSFGVSVINKDRQWIDKILKEVSLQNILLETDNQIDYSIKDIYFNLADKSTINITELAKQIELNFKSIFTL